MCSCNNVTKGAICATIDEQACADLPCAKACTRAGTTCGSCLPVVKNLLTEDGFEAAGRTVVAGICEHFDVTRQELFDLVTVHGYRRFDDIVEAHGRGRGCDVCKPAIASILASQFNGHVLDEDTPRAAGHQRQVPRQHPAQRHLLGGAAGARRRDHAREADRDRRGGPRLRSLHQDHRRPAHRPLRRPHGGAAGDLAAARRRRLRVRSRLRQVAAHREVLRRVDLVPLRRPGLDQPRDRRSSCATGACARRTSSRAGSAAAPASAPRPAARTSG